MQLVLALLTMLSTTAWATPHLDLDNTANAGVSGVKGEVIAGSFDADTKQLGIGGFTLYTIKGRTCLIASIVRPLPGQGATDKQLAVGMPTVECYPEFKSSTDQLNRHDVQRGGAYYVRGVTVCTQAGNTDERSIRGLRVWYAKVKPDGTVVPDDQPEVWVNATGCDKWEDRAMCPSDMVAMGIRGHKAGYGLRALGLKCAAIKP